MKDCISTDLSKYQTDIEKPVVKRRIIFKENCCGRGCCFG